MNMDKQLKLEQQRANGWKGYHRRTEQLEQYRKAAEDAERDYYAQQDAKRKRLTAVSNEGV